MFKSEKYLFILSAYLCVAVFSGCSKDVHDHPDITTGKDLFKYHCSACHKDTGKGNFLKGVPANKNTALSAGQVRHKIIGNDSDSKMSSFEKMSVEESEKLSAYVKRL